MLMTAEQAREVMLIIITNLIFISINRLQSLLIMVNQNIFMMTGFHYISRIS